MDFVAASSGLEIFALPSYFATPQPNEAILGQRRNQVVDSWFTPFSPTCIGSPGHGKLEWSLEGIPQFGEASIEIQQQLSAISGLQGTHMFTVGQVRQQSRGHF